MAVITVKVFADFHIHGRYSRGCSTQLTMANLEKFARIKGLSLLGTGDFTHPVWLRELKTDLEEDETGILRIKSGFNFVLQAELSNIYSQGGKGRRVHTVVLAPSFEAVDQINAKLAEQGRLDYDGRPIFGFTCMELVEMLKAIDERIEVIPAHVWTPWFSLFGSRSGFNSVEECFQDQTKHIHALETGLSSNPAMNWRVSKLDTYTLVSNSDSHSFWPWRIGREANVFNVKELTYSNIIDIIRGKDRKGFLFTIEVEPSYGKYHLDGHRACGVCLEPQESRKMRGLCPKCGNPLTIGVLSRVEELSDRKEGFKPKNAVPFKSLIPLSEILAAHLGVSQPFSKKVWTAYNTLIKEFGSELGVLLDASHEQLTNVVEAQIADAIIKVREGDVAIQAGYDGVYGRPLFPGAKTEVTEPKTEAVVKNKQKTLSDF